MPLCLVFAPQIQRNYIAMSAGLYSQRVTSVDSNVERIEQVVLNAVDHYRVKFVGLSQGNYVFN